VEYNGVGECNPDNAEDDWECRIITPTWTTEPPTEEGWYCIHRIGISYSAAPKICEVSRKFGVLRASFFNTDEPLEKFIQEVGVALWLKVPHLTTEPPKVEGWYLVVRYDKVGTARVFEGQNVYELQKRLIVNFITEDNSHGFDGNLEDFCSETTLYWHRIAAPTTFAPQGNNDTGEKESDETC
jgi:hypothetical protein